MCRSQQWDALHCLAGKGIYMLSMNNASWNDLNLSTLIPLTESYIHKFMTNYKPLSDICTM